MARLWVRLPVGSLAIKWLTATWMSDCLRSGKPCRYITNTKVDSAFHPYGVGKSSIGMSGWNYGGVRSLVSGGK